MKWKVLPKYWAQVYPKDHRASIAAKMQEGKAVIALTANGRWVGFSYIEIWAKGEFVSNSGLIVNPAYREQGVAKAIKEKIFQLSRKQYPAAKIFSITTSMAIMKMNTGFGFEPVTFENIPREDAFWQGCKSCVNYDILQRQTVQELPLYRYALYP